MRLARRSLTLIELLLVLTILAALAASAASFVEDSDDQFRYQDTKNRLTSIREAILGRAAGGRAQQDGFVADMGRLPTSLQELLDGAGLPAWQVDSTTGLGHGWRGPYLRGLPRADGQASFPDGWGNLAQASDPAGNHGWRFALSGDELTVQSRGRGGRDDALAPPVDTYATDYPPTPLVLAADHSLDLNGWSVQVRIESNSTDSVQLRLRYLVEAGGASTLVTYLSDPLTLSGTPGAQTFVFNLGAETRIPWGVKAFELVAGGSVRGAVQHVELRPRASLTQLPVGWSP